LDVNGTLTDRGGLIDGVEDRLRRLAEELRITLLSSETLGTLDALADSLGLEAIKVWRGEEKRAVVPNIRAADAPARIELDAGNSWPPRATT
jgi:soluble P-type ATPase